MPETLQIRFTNFDRDCLGSVLPMMCSWWVISGLGARGLVYHAWLGALLVQAIVKGRDDCLPSPLLRWRTTAAQN